MIEIEVPEIAVLDSCFIIDWSRFRKRNLIEHLFNQVYIHEEILDQLKSETSIRFIVNLMTKGKCKLYQWSSNDEYEFELLRSEIISNSRIPELERPDILCLIMARKLGAVLLTENIGVHRVVQFHPRYRGVKVWTALEVLENLIYKSILQINSIEEFITIMHEYEEDTKHRFSEKRIKQVLSRVVKWLKK